MKEKLSREIKIKMKRELEQYWQNKKKLKELEEKIIESSPGGLNGIPKNNSISDTTAQKAIKLVSTRSILFCKERIMYVENVINQLSQSEQKIFVAIFKDKCNCNYCETHYNISKTAYYNLYNKCIIQLAKEWGEI